MLVSLWQEWNFLGLISGMKYLHCNLCLIYFFSEKKISKRISIMAILQILLILQKLSKFVVKCLDDSIFFSWSDMESQSSINSSKTEDPPGMAYLPSMLLVVTSMSFICIWEWNCLYSAVKYPWCSWAQENA